MKNANSYLFATQACCPVCREPISKDADPLRDAAQPIELQNAPDFRVTSDLKSLQVRMANLYMHQMHRGGIIDSNADESNVISIESEDASEQVRMEFVFKIPQSSIVFFFVFDPALLCSKHENRAKNLPRNPNQPKCN